MKRTQLLQFVVAAGVILAGTVSTAQAAIVATGDVDPADPSTWNPLINAYIGKTGDGSVIVETSGSINCRSGYIGYGSGARGVVTMNGSGSTWVSNVDLFIGCSGIGDLTIVNGALVGNRDAYIGDASGSSGTVTVSGIGSKWNLSGLFRGSLGVGRSGVGMLNIDGGGSVKGTCFRPSVSWRSASSRRKTDQSPDFAYLLRVAGDELWSPEVKAEDLSRPLTGIP
jgi:T5SS/PEP-CTERM-associated repeat protein